MADLPKLALDPDASAYSFVAGSEILSTDIEFGPTLSRRDFIGAPDILQVQWVLDALEYKYLNAFYRASIAYGALPFLMDLIIDDGDLLECQCKIVPGSFTLYGLQGSFAFVVQALLEVKPARHTFRSVDLVLGTETGIALALESGELLGIELSLA